MKPRHLNCLAHFGDPPDGSIDVRESVYMYLYKEKIAREHLTGPQHYPDNGLVSGTRGKVSRNQEEEEVRHCALHITICSCDDHPFYRGTIRHWRWALRATPPLLCPSERREPAYLYGSFSSVNSRFPQMEGHCITIFLSIDYKRVPDFLC
ncbi:hypothetical protein AVEN_218126-1 [Araneus ventricosus]|uniref:Uncharacterized protein n=1 Tax=Araneus ventricosus TaxID=182803 RepID=A0A4Y2I5J0_ARAVE|nr:hypothetical protein AVEN_218126-1 [Araneus ventricosus]